RTACVKNPGACGMLYAPAVSAEPQPHTVRPKGALLVISWRPLSQLPCWMKSCRTRSMRVYSYVSAASMGFQPVSVPAQSRLTSEKTPFTDWRTTTRLVSGYVGSVKNVYDESHCALGTTSTNSGSPRQSVAWKIVSQPVMWPLM